MGLEQNDEEALRYVKEAAKGGDILSHQILGCAEKDDGNDVAARRHFRLTTSGGHSSNCSR